MQKGALMDSQLDHLVSHVLSVSLVIQLCLAAPGLPGSNREMSIDAHLPPVLSNPFGAGDEERRFLQSYIQSSLKDEQVGSEISSWEQEVFFLFRLYDYDRSGFLDGLEMMKLLSDFTSHHAPGAEANEQVVSMVDFLLQSHDLNQDGLLDPSELLSPPLTHTKGSGDMNVPSAEQEVAVNNEIVNTVTEEENGKAENGEDQNNVDIQPSEEEERKEEITQHEVMTGEEVKQVIQHDEQQLQEANAEQHKIVKDVPAHQGQPEI